MASHPGVSRQLVRPPRPAWIAIYTRRLVLTDLVAVVIAVGGSHLLWFGFRQVDLAGADWMAAQVSYLTVSAVLIAGWMLGLGVFGTRDARIVGSGLTEYARTADASLRFFGLVAIVALLLQVDIARGYIITAFPVGLLLLETGRWTWRQWLRRRRYEGKYLMRVLVAGSPESAVHLASELRRAAYAGYEVVGVCLTRPDADAVAEGLGVPVFHDLSSLTSAASELDAHSVALAGSEGLPPKRVQRISWELERTGVELMVAPSVTDVAGARIHTRPVAGLPLLYVESPRYEGFERTVKAVFDFSAALVMLILLSPLLLGLAIAIKVSSRGPVLFTQERVGRNGRSFSILKFRSMRDGADAELPSLLEAQQTADRPLFKIKDDPRVTPVGRFLRRRSLDELPQLLNVLRGEMSLVGPRPQTPEEVALYDTYATRRLLVKPGLTGLWQVSGRSELTWDEALRLDLYYVENWSLTDDFVILLRTFRAVLLRSGAY